MSILGIDLGGTKVALAAFTVDGLLLKREITALSGREGAEVGALICDLARSFIDTMQEADPVRSIGVCVPGISRIRTGTAWAPNIPGWDDYPLLRDLMSVAGDIPVNIDSDRACYMLGELWQGNAKGCSDAIFLGVGTGIGAGILVNGTILRGAHDIAGAIGWLALNRPFKDKYSSCGCFEHHASGEGIAKIAREILINDIDYRGMLRYRNPELITARDIFDAYDQRDSLAIEVMDQCVELWGMAVANLISLFNPEKIIFGGGVFGPAEQFIPAIKAEAEKWAQPISATQVSIEKSGMGGDAGVYGAGFLALQHIND